MILASIKTHMTHPKYRPDIDGLRALAVSLVVIFHLFPNLVKGGFVGVDIFFVISGFLISTIIFSNMDSGNFTFIGFYIRRVKRIFPALLFVLFFSMVIGWFILFADEYQMLGKHVSGGSLFVANFIFLRESGYFDVNASLKPLLHLWSLGIEEQYYIVWPFLVWLIYRFISKGMIVFLLIGIVVSFTMNILLISKNPTLVFYSPQTRFWELLIGSILAYLVLNKEKYLRILDNKYLSFLLMHGILSVIGIFLIILSTLLIDKSSMFPGWLALMPTMGAFFIILSGPNAFVNRYFLSNKLMVWIGLISYPIYLWHWIFISFNEIIGINETIYFKFIIIFITFLLSWITYRFIETPIRFKIKSNISGIILFFLMIGTFILGLAIYKSNGVSRRDAVIKSNIDNTEFIYGSHWKGWTNCNYVKAINSNLGGCYILNKQKPASIAIIGDSHAGHLASGVLDIFQDRKENVIIMLHAGCLPVLSEINNRVKYFDCQGNFIDNAYDYIINSKDIKTVILSGYTALKINGSRFYERTDVDSNDINNNIAIFKSGLENTLKLLNKSNKKIIYIIDNPEILKDPKSCIERPLITKVFNNKCNISYEEYLNRSNSFRNVVFNLGKKYNNLVIIDFSKELCNENECFASKNGKLLYATQDHLTPYGSRYLMNKVAEQIFAILDRK